MCRFVQSTGAYAPGRGRSGRQVELCVAEEELWVPLPEDEGCVLQVVMSAQRLEEGLGLAPGQLPQSLVDGKELVLLLVSAPSFAVESWCSRCWFWIHLHRKPCEYKYPR